MRNLRIIVLFLIVLTIRGCNIIPRNIFSQDQTTKSSSLEDKSLDIDKAIIESKVEFPLDTKEEAIQYSLLLDQVNAELNKPLQGAMAKYNIYGWWADAYILEARSNNEKTVWAVNWFKGPGECESPHGCQIHIDDKGNVISKISCSDGWNCE